MYTMNETKEIANECCKVLGIERVPIKTVTKSEVPSITRADSLAFYNRENDTVYIIRKKQYELFDMYVVFHELRHAYQNRLNPTYYFSEYTADLSEVEYNRFKAEIDANAFATIAIAGFFGKVTNRNYRNDSVAMKLYEKRLNALKKEYGIYF